MNLLFFSILLVAIIVLCLIQIELLMEKREYSNILVFKYVLH